MLFFKRSASARSRRSSFTHKARLRVEQLETRLALSTVLPGDEFRVNTTTAGTQQSSSSGAHSVAVDAAGDYVVSWASNGQDGNGWGVYARRYNAAGTPAGSAFRVNSTIMGDQQDIDVATDSAGDFVVTWGSNSQDGGGWGVYGQRYNALGVAQGTEFRINTTTAGDQKCARVAMNAAGDFVVTWSSNGQDGSGWGVYGQRYNAAGVAQGSEFRVSTTTAGDQMNSAVAADSTGNFVVTWSSNGQDGSGWGVYGQRFNSAGVAQGSEFRAATTTAGDQTYASVAMNATGDFVITWSSNGQDGSGWGVYAQRYNSCGTAQGSELLVSTCTAGDQMFSSAAIDGTGKFTITWSSYGEDGSGWSVYAQQFTQAGNHLGDEFLVSTTTAGDQMNSSLALTSSGQAVFVWSGNGAGDNSGLFGQQRQLQ